MRALDAAQRLKGVAQPITSAADDLDPLMERIGDRPLVLLGEATHGTHEFYAQRARITRRLVEEKGFTDVALEADWPDAYRINRYVRHLDGDDNARDALGDFQRFPTWMWRNADVLEFVDWLRAHNRERPAAERVGVYGLDLYSLYASIEAVIGYLEQLDPNDARRARERYACLDQFGDDPVAYGRAASLGKRPSCEPQVLEQLIELRRGAADYLQRNGMPAEDAQFFAEQNARVVRNAEAYYRGMFGYRVNTWNLRDRHMSETLAALLQHRATQRGRPKIAVWEHNSHLGDARATEMARRGELNVGQLTRERYGDDAVLIGFTTYDGTVAAASRWDGPVRHKRVRPALPESYEALLHEVGSPQFALVLNQRGTEDLEPHRLQRAIGVIYRPETERQSHYFACNLRSQFDAVVHVDRTSAVEPLDPVSSWEIEEAPETYPFGV